MAGCFFHSWDGCKCRKCSKVRDENHDWNGCKCRKCNKVRDKNHDWNGCKCGACGESRYGNEYHRWGKNPRGATECEICGHTAPIDVLAQMRDYESLCAIMADYTASSWYHDMCEARTRLEEAGKDVVDSVVACLQRHEGDENLAELLVDIGDPKAAGTLKKQLCERKFGSVTGNPSRAARQILEFLSKHPDVQEPTQTVTESAEPITDLDGNLYHVTRIGNQVWAVENLRVTKFNDGSPIPQITDDSEWERRSTQRGEIAYCWYANDIKSKADHGALYNWHAVETGKLAPKGWHVPTDEDWTELTMFLKLHGSVWEGKKSGYRDYSGFFNSLGSAGYWWSATEHSDIYAPCAYLDYDNSELEVNERLKGYACSVRIIKDVGAVRNSC